MLVHIAMRRLGPLDENALAKLKSINHVAILVAFIDKLESVETWNDLLATG